MTVSLYRSLTVLAFICYSHFAFSQEELGKTYVILNNGIVTDVQPYITALNKSNMQFHRLRNTRHTFSFNTGVTVQLFSAAECIANGRNIQLSDYPETFAPERKEPVFSLGPNDFIMEQVSPQFKHR